jgi:hypothetical protein
MLALRAPIPDSDAEHQRRHRIAWRFQTSYSVRSMERFPLSIQRVVRHLFSVESAHAESSNGALDQAVAVCERLRVPLTKLAGAAGFSSLLSRALVLARRKAFSLEGLRVEADGALAGFDEVSPDLHAARNGGVILISELLSLLILFIGEPLTLGLVREAWPDAPIGTTKPTTEETP